MKNTPRGRHLGFNAESRHYSKPPEPTRHFVSPHEPGGHRVAERKTKASDRIRLPDGTEMTLGEAFDAGLVTPTCSDYYDPPRYFARSKDGTVSWEIGKTFYLSRTGGVLLFKKSMNETGHRVADFNTLDDLVAHARGEGATHYIQIDDETHLYFQRKDGSYEKSEVWQKDGYWHTQGPGSRVIVRRPPSGARAIGGGSRIVEASRERLYHVVAINERTGRKEYLTATPVTHQEGVTIMRKQSGPHRDVRIQLEPANEGHASRTVYRRNQSVRDYIAVDPRDRQIAGPFKNYGDARQEADNAGGVVKFVPSKGKVNEARGTSTSGLIDVLTRRGSVHPELATQLADRYQQLGIGPAELQRRLNGGESPLEIAQMPSKPRVGESPRRSAHHRPARKPR